VGEIPAYKYEAVELTRWTPVDVYGRPWMAPRAGFEVRSKPLNVHFVQRMDELNTPARTPRFSIMDSRR
jgi:hypothetical protein